MVLLLLLWLEVHAQQILVVLQPVVHEKTDQLWTNFSLCTIPFYSLFPISNKHCKFTCKEIVAVVCLLNRMGLGINDQISQRRGTFQLVFDIQSAGKRLPALISGQLDQLFLGNIDLYLCKLQSSWFGDLAFGLASLY